MPGFLGFFLNILNRSNFIRNRMYFIKDNTYFPKLIVEVRVALADRISYFLLMHFKSLNRIHRIRDMLEML
jgi:hypothetical protein